MEEYSPEKARECVLENAPRSNLSYSVYLMGPYTAENLRYGLQERGNEAIPEHYDDALVDYAQESDMEECLKVVRDFIRDEYEFRAFLASDIPILTHEEAIESDDPDACGMTPATQSKMFAAVSNAVIYIFPYAGLTDGVANEFGGIGEFLNLSMELPGEPLKPAERCLALKHYRHNSATVNEHRFDCQIVHDEYRFADGIEPAIKDFLDAVFDADQHQSDNDFPVHSLPADQHFTAMTPTERRQSSSTFHSPQSES